MKKKILIALAVILLILLGYGAYFGYNLYKFTNTISTNTTPEEGGPVDLAQPTLKDNLNILVLGIDTGNFKDNTVRTGGGRSDTIMLFSIDEKNNKVYLLSVPRDTYVDIPGRGKDKVNHAYAFGGIDLSVKALSNFLDIPIHHYVRVNYSAFVKAVDGLGGVTINVTEDVTFFGDGKVKVAKGLQKMDGETAFNYVQVREGDIARVQRQQKFVKAMGAQALTVKNLPKFPTILNSIAPNIRTDMTPKEMLDLAWKLKSMDVGNMPNKIVPGKASMIRGVSYWLADVPATKEIVKQMFFTKE